MATANDETQAHDIFAAPVPDDAQPLAGSQSLGTADEQRAAFQRTHPGPENAMTVTAVYSEEKGDGKPGDHTPDDEVGFLSVTTP